MVLKYMTPTKHNELRLLSSLHLDTVEPVLGDLWFGQPRLGRPQSPGRIVSNNKVPGVSDHLPDATHDRVIWFNQR